ncbi:hypothetical protein [Acidianus sp. HS-5]|uniref:hypothetical protein n=1 Tax=Acidianus sp. HS-5 TaxID=2886040 RepID=UPI001F26C940|nr:hypothetical protein [Acidianus sp. HS-5]BDC17502.1 hypothetical protein HS5_03920 [Acidianus sp. HS-5]
MILELVELRKILSISANEKIRLQKDREAKDLTEVIVGTNYGKQDLTLRKTSKTFVINAVNSYLKLNFSDTQRDLLCNIPIACPDVLAGNAIIEVTLAENLPFTMTKVLIYSTILIALGLSESVKPITISVNHKGNVATTIDVFSVCFMGKETVDWTSAIAIIKELLSHKR